jgi:membrane-bound lytic murein transglycosylase MltF
MRKYRATVEFFRKYAGQYGFDYLMVTAQAYQESRLDQRLRSRAGAVGVMQVKPSTAAGAPIGIRDVTRVDANVHAGVKYLRFILDRYLDDPAMDPVNRGLFAFAAYNAGPARVQGLRRQAAARGLDPNRWFGHVEHVAAREIGRETVQYVSNIYKYYLAYTMVTEREEARRQAAGSRPSSAKRAATPSR